ncbi:MAG TPA: BON domain-containing protein [Thermoanaerobaculia bacterium]|jgi:osmotically-inducible protein OsmY
MMRTITKAVAIAALVMTLTPVATAAVPATTDLTPNFIQAGASLDRLQVYEIAGIVIIRGRAFDKAQAEEVGRVAQSLGYTRVANLVQVVENRDAEIARAAEVELSVHRSLEGCNFRVTSDNGNLRVAGEVQRELQKDVAMQVLRNIDGVKALEVTLNRF